MILWNYPFIPISAVPFSSVEINSRIFVLFGVHSRLAFSPWLRGPIELTFDFFFFTQIFHAGAMRSLIFNYGNFGNPQ